MSTVLVSTAFLPAHGVPTAPAVVTGPAALTDGQALNLLLALAPWTLAAAFVLSVLLPFAVKPLLRRWGVIDIPSDRSSHSRPVLRGMGLAVAIALILTYGLSLGFGLIPVDRSLALSVLAMTAASAALGWAEDYRGVSIGVRLGMQALVGALGTAAMIVALGIPAWWWPVGVLATVAYVNIANFMDGINGISGLHGGVVGLFYAWAGAANGMPWMVGAGLALVLRIRRGEVWYTPHRQHVYQRLTDVGLSHVQSATVVTTATACVSLISLYGLRAAGTGSVLAGVAVVLVIVLYLVSPVLLDRARSTARSLRP